MQFLRNLSRRSYGLRAVSCFGRWGFGAFCTLSSSGDVRFGTVGASYAATLESTPVVMQLSMQ